MSAETTAAGGRSSNVLLVRLSAIGDVVHTLPVASVLHARGWRVEWLVEPAARPLLVDNPSVDHVVSAPPARLVSLPAAFAAARVLRRRSYDMALDLQGLWKSAAWARLSGARRVLGYARPGRREPLSSMLLGEMLDLVHPPAHVIDKNLALLRMAAGLEVLGMREFPLPPGAEEAARVDAALSAFGAGEFAILNPGGGWTSKLWAPESFGVVAQGLRAHGLASIVTWGPGEERLADRVVAASDGAARRAFPTTLLEYLALARRARLVVAADTGPLHLACAVKTPVVGIFGPTDPARNGPFSSRDLTVRRQPLCAPCHRRRCPVHEGVMEAIPPAEVVKACERRLGLGAARTVAV